MLLKPRSNPRKIHDWYTVHNVNVFFKDHFCQVQTLISEIIKVNDCKILIEIGSGMGIPLNLAAEKNPDLTQAIGIDQDQSMLDHCNKEYNNKKLLFLHGDANNLLEVLNEKAPNAMKQDKKIVMMIGNTLNLFSTEQKLEILNQMTLVAGKHGLVLLVNFNADNFGKSIQHFYDKVPEWYNGIHRGEFDFTECTFKEPISGYSTKWYTKAETEQYVYKAGWDIQTFREIDLGIAFVGRYLPKPQNDQNQTLSDDFDNSSRKSGISEKEESDNFSIYDTESLRFYQAIRGGTELHIGVYENHQCSPDSDRSKLIRDASQKSQEVLWEKSHEFLHDKYKKEGFKMIDFGSAYGDQAIKFVKKGANFVSCVEISAKQNIICKKKINSENLELHISNPGERSYTDTGEPDESFHMVYSQDSFLHAKEKLRLVLKEASRILVNGGILCFSDILMSDEKDASIHLKQLFGILKVESLGSYKKYMKFAADYDLELIEFIDLSESQTTHYTYVLHLLKQEGDQLKLTKDYQEKTAEGLKMWINLSKASHLQYGIFFFRKREQDKVTENLVLNI